MKKKILLIGCGCALLVIALVVCLVLVIGNDAGNNTNLPSNGTEGTTQGTNPDGTTMTNPDGTTNPTTTPTVPSDPTVPSSDPTAPTTGATDPTEPSGTTDPTEPSVTTEPTEPPYSYPTEPNGDVIPIDPNEGTVTTPTVTPVDLGGVTVDTITTEIFNNWSGEQRRAFLEYYNANGDNMTLDQKYYVAQQIGGRVWDDEEAIAKGIYAGSEKSYKSYLEQMALGCKYCGDTNCVAFYARAETGYTYYDKTKCPLYNEEYDPSIYCQECGYKLHGETEVGETGCTKTVSKDLPCWNCGEMRHAGQCHNCVLRPEEEQYQNNK